MLANNEEHQPKPYLLYITGDRAAATVAADAPAATNAAARVAGSSPDTT